MKLKTLTDDLLVFVECDAMSEDIREDLFMPSRDRLAETEFKDELIDGLEQALRNDEALRQLRNKRQQERMTDQMKDDKPLADVLKHLIRSSPNLTALLHLGQRITAPFNTNPTGSKEDEPFKGELYLTFFKIKGVPYGAVHKRGCPINYRMRLSFETDARDDYFDRRIEGGKFSLKYMDKSGMEGKVSWIGPTLRRGTATVMVTVPEDVEIGQIVEFVARTKDTRSEFENRTLVTIKPPAEHRESGTRERTRKRPDTSVGKDRERPREFATPKIVPVYRAQWEDFKFDEYTAMKMDTEYDEADNEVAVFQVNMDNTPSDLYPSVEKGQHKP